MESKNSITQTTTVHADIAKVFGVLTDVENWHSWTKSINKISFTGEKKFEVGGQAKVFQPKLLPAVWTITEITAPQSFTWQTKTLGVSMTATHVLTSTSNGTGVTLQMTYEGLLAGLLYRLSSNLTTQYLTMEIKGLKAACEQR